MIIARSLAFNCLFYFWTILMLVLCTPVLVLDRMITVRCQTLWAHGVLWLMRKLVKIELKICGKENLSHFPIIIASKHQSAWDTLIWHVIVKDPALVMKRELLFIPWYGWYSEKAGMIPIDRRGGSSAIKYLLKKAEQAKERKQPIIIFPQGTRTMPGSYYPYQPGVAALYRTLNLPVVPVALNSGLFWPRRSLKLNPGIITVQFLPTIQPGLDRKSFLAKLEKCIESANKILDSTL